MYLVIPNYEEYSNTLPRPLSAASSEETFQHSKSHHEDPIGDVEKEATRKRANNYNDTNENTLPKYKRTEKSRAPFDSGTNSLRERLDIDNEVDADANSIRRVNRVNVRDAEFGTNHRCVGKTVENNDVRVTRRRDETSMTQYDYAAKSWAVTLNQLPKDQQLYASRVINEVLFQAQMGKLSDNTRLVLSSQKVQNEFGPITLRHSENELKTSVKIEEDCTAGTFVV